MHNFIKFILQCKVGRFHKSQKSNDGSQRYISLDYSITRRTKNGLNTSVFEEKSR